MDKDDSKERRCMSCHKLLIGEKLPFCRRCRLKGRNNAAKVFSFSAGLATIVATVSHTDNSN